MEIYCCLCGERFEVDEEMFLEDYDPLNDDEFDVCPGCYEDILNWIVERN